MGDNFNVFYCTICHVCKSSPTSPETMKFCSGCRLVQYCCNSHQKDDWQKHKELCKSVQHILKKTETNHVFKEACVFNEQDLVSWSRLRMSVLRLLELVLKRSLTSTESQIILFPPVCNFCHCYKLNKMFSCGLCNTVMYCSSEHQRIDKKHRSVCKFLSLSFSIDMFRLSKQQTFNISESIKKIKCLNEFPQNMESALQQSSNSFSSEDLLLSELLSYSLTLIFVIDRISKITTSSVSIHIVGADDMEVLVIETLPIVFYFLPHLTHLKIIMVGPNLSSNISVPSDINGKCSLYSIRNTLYQEYVTSSSSIHPDVIVLFNCGFCEFSDVPEKDTWKNSLPYILDFSNCTIILTSYTAREAKSDLKRLCDMKGNDLAYDVLLENKVNPYSSLYPHRDWEIEYGDVFYVNKYMSVLKTL